MGKEKIEYTESIIHASDKSKCGIFALLLSSTFKKMIAVISLFSRKLQFEKDFFSDTLFFSSFLIFCIVL